MKHHLSECKVNTTILFRLVLRVSIFFFTEALLINSRDPDEFEVVTQDSKLIKNEVKPSNKPPAPPPSPPQVIKVVPIMELEQMHEHETTNELITPQFEGKQLNRKKHPLPENADIKLVSRSIKA